MSLRFYVVMIAAIQLISLVSAPRAAAQGVDQMALRDFLRQGRANEAQRRQLANSVLEVVAELSSPKQSPDKAAAISALGRLRAVNAIPFLIDNASNSSHGTTSKTVRK